MEFVPTTPMIDAPKPRSYGTCVQTVVNVDEQVLTLAEQQARRNGKSLDSLVEDALRAALHLSPAQANACDAETESVDADAAFFDGLEEIRALGRLSAAHRQVDLP